MIKAKTKISFDSVLPSKTGEASQAKTSEAQANIETDTKASAMPKQTQTRPRKVNKPRVVTGDDIYKTIAIRLNKSEYQEIRKYQLEAELADKSVPDSLASMGKAMILKQVRRATNV